MVSAVGGEKTENNRKPIDYIPEPYRHDLLEQFEKIVKIRDLLKKTIEQKSRVEVSKPLSQLDMLEMTQQSLVIVEALTDVNTSVIEITALYFKDKEKN